jgi:hypothetical protein
MREALEVQCLAEVAAKEASMLRIPVKPEPEARREPPSGGPPPRRPAAEREESRSSNPNWFDRVGPIGLVLVLAGLVATLAAAGGFVGLTMTNPIIKYQFMMWVLISMTIASGLIAGMIGKANMGSDARETYRRTGLGSSVAGIFLIIASNVAFTPVAILNGLIIIMLVVVGLMGIALVVHLARK